MPKLKFTARSIEAIRPPKTGQVDYWDSSVPGFILRVSYGGRKVWGLVYRHEGRKRRLSLGAYPALSLADAREKANDALREVAHGKDPAADKRAQYVAETFGQLAAEFLEKHSRKKKRSWRVDERAFKRDLLPRFGHRRANSISRKEVVRLLDNIVERGAGIQANRTLEILRKCYNWAISRDIVSHNPCQGIERPADEHSRERVLSNDEISAVWKALDDEEPMVAAAFRLRLLTAQRGQEIETMRHEDIDRTSGWWTIPGERTKNGLAHRVPLSRQTMDVLDALDGDAEGDVDDHGDDAGRDHQGWVFQSSKRDGPVTNLWRATADIRKSAAKARDGEKVDFVPHDLRRTAASKMTGDLGISRFVVGQILNHVQGGSTAVYDRASYDREKQQALDAWGNRVEQIVAGKPSEEDEAKVVPMRRG